MNFSYSSGTTVVVTLSLLNFSKTYFDLLGLSNIYLETPFHLTNPPQIDRAALPDPNLASSDNYASVSKFPNNPFKAAAKQANPEADDAIPEAVGNEFTDYILK